jgi:hypothetical protein
MQECPSCLPIVEIAGLSGSLTRLPPHAWMQEAKRKWKEKQPVKAQVLSESHMRQTIITCGTEMQAKNLHAELTRKFTYNL